CGEGGHTTNRRLCETGGDHDRWRAGLPPGRGRALPHAKGNVRPLPARVAMRGTCSIRSIRLETRWRAARKRGPPPVAHDRHSCCARRTVITPPLAAASSTPPEMRLEKPAGLT